MSQISFKLFYSGNKRVLLKFLRKWRYFRDILNVFLNILAENLNFKKLRHRFVDERAQITTILILFCHWKTLPPFCSRKKRPRNVSLILIVNYHKIVQENKLRHLKNSKLASQWYMLFSHWLFWLKNCFFSTKSCKVFIVFLSKLFHIIFMLWKHSLLELYIRNVPWQNMF